MSQLDPGEGSNSRFSFFKDSVCVWLWLSWTSLCTPGWSRTHRCTCLCSRALGLKVFLQTGGAVHVSAQLSSFRPAGSALPSPTTLLRPLLGTRAPAPGLTSSQSAASAPRPDS